MPIDVKLVSGFAKTLTYKVPADWPALEINMLIRVPVRTARILALIVKIYPETKQSAFFRKSRTEPFPTGSKLFFLFTATSSYYQVPTRIFYKTECMFFLKKKLNHPLTKIPDTQQDKIFQELPLPMNKEQ